LKIQNKILFGIFKIKYYFENTILHITECCPDAVFFTTIPKLDDDTDTADEDELSCLFPLLMSGLFRAIYSFIFLKIILLLFCIFRSYSFLFAVLWWPVKWGFVAFLVT